jgi:hypothetical protein
MKLQIFFRALAVYTIGLFGLVWLLYPQAGLGAHPDPFSLLIARSLGTNFIVIGLMDWAVSNQRGRLQRILLGLNIVVHSIPAAINVIYILNGVFDTSKWAGVVFHALPLIGCLLFFVKWNKWITPPLR